MDTIGSSRPWLSCQGICLLNRHQTGDTDSVQPVILLPVQRDSQETFIPVKLNVVVFRRQNLITAVKGHYRTLVEGPQPPLLPQDERARLLAALACVDYVTIFSEATPLALIECLRPHVLVKGGDYTFDTVVGRKEVEAYGGEVRIVPSIPGVSTTGIIDSVLARYSPGADHS